MMISVSIHDFRVSDAEIEVVAPKSNPDWAYLCISLEDHDLTLFSSVEELVKLGEEIIRQGKALAPDDTENWRYNY